MTEQRATMTQMQLKQTENMAIQSDAVIPDKNTGSKCGKFVGIIVLIVVVVVCLIGVGVYNTPANRMSRHLDLGVRYLEEQNYEQAVVEFDQVIAIDPMSVDAYLGKAQGYEGMGDMEKAIETLMAGYEKTGDAQLKAQLVDAYLEQAAGYVQAADYDSALAVYDKLLELDGENERVQAAIGDCLTDYIEQLIGEERYDEAKALIEKYRDRVQSVDFEEYLEIITYEEKLSNKDVLLESIPQFDYSDIKILGYELKESKYNEIINSIGYSYKYDELGLGWIKPQADIIISVSDSSYIDVFSSGYSNSLTINTPLSGVEEFAELGARPMNGQAEVTAFEYLQSSHSSVINFRKVNGIETTASQLGESWCGSSLPILLGDTYEKWCSIMGVDLPKQSPIVEREIEDHTEWGEKIERYNIVSESALSSLQIKSQAEICEL